MRASIKGTGSFLPKRIATNDFLSGLVDTSDEWIRTRTGISQRHLAVEETTASMSAEAAKRALSDAGMAAGELDAIIVCTCTPDTYTPNTACTVQAAIGATQAVAFDISAACSGFIFGMILADNYIQTGMYKNILVIGAETLSRIVDWSDRSTCVLFADGAGAAVVVPSEKGVIAATQGSNGMLGDAIYAKTRGNCNPFCTEREPIGFVSMDGQEVYKFATRKVPASIEETVKAAGLEIEDIDLFILHQANTRINKVIAKKLGIPTEKMPENLDRVGNTSGASIPLVLDEVCRKGLIKKGDKIVLAGFGAGLTWGTIVMEW